MIPRFEILTEKKLAGKRLKMSLSGNKTKELWQSFMPERKDIKNVVGTELYSLQIYDLTYFEKFNPEKEFEKWAAVEVADFNSILSGIESFILPGGLYAVFNYKGAASAGYQAFQYIYGAWLPNSGYRLDGRPHFEILGDKYKNDNPDSEEEIWIPVKLKE